jgi:hypothetical protein
MSYFSEVYTEGPERMTIMIMTIGLSGGRQFISLKISATLVNIQQLCVLTIECIYGFRTILRINSNYLTKQH